MESRGGFGLPFLEPTATCMSTLESVHYNSVMDMVSVLGVSTMDLSGMILNTEDTKKSNTWSLSSCTHGAVGGQGINRSCEP